MSEFHELHDPTAELYSPEGRKREYPVNVIDETTSSQHIVEECVICGETHYHGNATPTEPGKYGHRVAHCDREVGYNGYWLKVPEEGAE